MVRKVLIYISPAIIFFCLWEFFVHNNQQRQFLFGSPVTVYAVAIEELVALPIWIDIATTVLEASIGLVLGSSLGTIIGLLLWTNPVLAKLSRPYIIVLGSIPIFAIAPMLIIWFGTGLLSKVVMSAFAVVFVSLAQVYDGARFCAEQHSHYARSIGASHMHMIRKVIVPGALRSVTAGLRISIGLALIGAFIGEFVSSQCGLGHYILKAGSLYDMHRVLFGVALISIIALLMTGLVFLIERWRPHLFAH
jgi:NitT/TauT family transport system permease protein